MVNILQGQRVTWDLQGGKLPRQRKTLLRAEAPQRNAWSITLAPIFMAGVGTTTAGMPAWQQTRQKSGGLVVVITWGGGGVNWQTSFSYPVAGASFTVAGDNVQVEVEAQDNASAFTDLNKPAVIGWCKPQYSVADQPLHVAVNYASGDTVPVYPFAKFLTVALANAAATVTLVWRDAFGGVYQQIVTQNLARIPVPCGMESVTITASDGVSGTPVWEIHLS